MRNDVINLDIKENTENIHVENEVSNKIDSSSDTSDNTTEKESFKQVN